MSYSSYALEVDLLSTAEKQNNSSVMLVPSLSLIPPLGREKTISRCDYSGTCYDLPMELKSKQVGLKRVA